MALEDLTSDEKKVVLQCLRASVEGSFFPEWEFSTLFGLTRAEVQEVIQRWPVDDTSDEMAALAINNAINNLLGYPHRKEEEWSKYISVSREEVHSIFRKWRDDEVARYFNGLR